MKNFLIKLGRKYFSKNTRRKLFRLSSWPPVGWVRFGNLRRKSPINRDWGFTRGTPIDRYYIEKYLGSVSDSIKGHVLEFKDNSYTIRFGKDRVTKSDVLHKEGDNPQATIFADISIPNSLPANTFDCIICTQTLQFIFDVKIALSTLHRSLAPGGALLVTVPVIAQISRADMELWGDYWRFTSLSARLMFEEYFEPSNISVQVYGNVLAATAFLYGLASEDLKQKELDFFDQDYELIIAIRAVK